MVTDPLTLINTCFTPQTQQVDPRQVQNSAGGYVFAIDDMARLRRFITMGSAGGTYYVGEQELTRENADVVIDLVRTRGSEVVAEILAISRAGRAPKQNPAIFALAVAAGLGDDETRRLALAVLPQVCRTGTHLFLFAKYIEQFRGWGRGLRRAVGRWYTSKDPDQLAYQLVKYRSREGYTHRDLLRLSHPAAETNKQSLAFDFACGRTDGVDERLPLLEGFMKAQSAIGPMVTAELVAEYGLPWEALKPDHLTDARVWAALLDHGLPQTALMRNLPRLTNLGLLGGHSGRQGGKSRTTEIASRLAGGMSKAKVHPVNVLIALRTYASGQSVRGSSTWTPVPQIVDALDAGFYEAFGGVEPAGKRTLIALDVSGSMGYQHINGLPITPREASAAMTMVTVATEPDVQVVGFTAGSSRGYGWQQSAALTPLDLSPRRRLDDAVRSISNLPFGGTDCSLPWVWATENGHEFDTVITLTDNETYGGVHVFQALRRYRERSGIQARHIVCGMTSTGFSINDPSDPLGLDISGMDSDVPNLISDFSAGRV